MSLSPDLIFSHRRLVAIYDELDGERVDLQFYLNIARALGARRLLDVGSGTGCFAALARAADFDVVAVEPSRASLEYARNRPGTNGVEWLHGIAADLSPLNCDLALMTGNVAQVFLTENDWLANLQGIRRALSSRGYLVFESRNPARKAWEGWTKANTYSMRILGGDRVESWCEVLGVESDQVSFRRTFSFASDGLVLRSDSMLRFRTEGALRDSLLEAGFVVHDVVDAPDRPGKELVFIAQRDS